MPYSANDINESLTIKFNLESYLGHQFCSGYSKHIQSLMDRVAQQYSLWQ